MGSDTDAPVSLPRIIQSSELPPSNDNVIHGEPEGGSVRPLPPVLRQGSSENVVGEAVSAHGAQPLPLVAKPADHGVDEDKVPRNHSNVQEIVPDEHTASAKFQPVPPPPRALDKVGADAPTSRPVPGRPMSLSKPQEKSKSASAKESITQRPPEETAVPTMKDAGEEADGAVVEADGAVVEADGAVVEADGAVVEADGAVVDGFDTVPPPPTTGGAIVPAENKHAGESAEGKPEIVVPAKDDPGLSQSDVHLSPVGSPGQFRRAPEQQDSDSIDSCKMHADRASPSDSGGSFISDGCLGPGRGKLMMDSDDESLAGLDDDDDDNEREKMSVDSEMFQPQDITIQNAFVEHNSDLPSLLHFIDKRKAKVESEEMEKKRKEQMELRRSSLADKMCEMLDHEKTGVIFQTELVKFLIHMKGEHIPVQFYTEPRAEGEEEYFPQVTLAEVLEDGHPIEDYRLTYEDVKLQFELVSLDDLELIIEEYEKYLKQMEKECYVTTLGSGVGGQELSPECRLNLLTPRGVATDETYLYIADTDRNRIQRVHLMSGTVKTLAGSGEEGFLDGDGATAQFNHPMGLQCDGKGKLFVMDAHNNAVREVNTSTGDVRTIFPPSTDLSGLGDLEGDGDRYVDDLDEEAPLGAVGDGTDEALDCPVGCAYVPDQRTLYITSDHRIQALKIDSGRLYTIAGSEYSDGFNDGDGQAARFYSPRGIVYVPHLHSLYICDFWNQRIRCLSLSDNKVTTTCGDGLSGFRDGAGMASQFHGPSGIVYDGMRSLYICDVNNNCIRKLHLRSQLVSTIAGSGNRGWCDGFAPQAEFFMPSAIAFTENHALYVADTKNHLCRQVKLPKRPLADGETVLTVSPISNSKLYVADSLQHRILLLDLNTNNQIVIAGSGVRGFKDGPLAQAEFDTPKGLALAKNGLLYVADYGNHRIRKLDPNTGLVTTVAGDGHNGFRDGVGTHAQLDSPYGISYVDDDQCLVFGCNEALRKMDLVTGQVTTIAVTVPVFNE